MTKCFYELDGGGCGKYGETCKDARNAECFISERDRRNQDITSGCDTIKEMVLKSDIQSALWIANRIVGMLESEEFLRAHGLKMVTEDFMTRRLVPIEDGE